MAGKAIVLFLYDGRRRGHFMTAAKLSDGEILGQHRLLRKCICIVISLY